MVKNSQSYYKNSHIYGNSKISLITIDGFYWLVRYSAVMGLSHVCRLCKTQDIKDGFSWAAWDTLMQRHSVEQNEKVLDAYRLSNVR